METPSLLRRKLFFGNPDRLSVQLSPDGAHLSWLAALEGVLNVWVAPRANPAAARPVTRDTGRGIRSYFWAFTNRHLLYLKDNNGDENYRLHAVELETNADRDLTPFAGVQTRVVAGSANRPEEIVVGLNQRKAEWHDLYRLNVVSGKLTSLLEHERFVSVLVDDDFQVRVAAQLNADGSMTLFTPTGADWQEWMAIPAEDTLTTQPLGFAKDNQTLFMKDSRQRDTAALVAVTLPTSNTRTLAADPQADTHDVVRQPRERHVQAVSFVHTRKKWQILDPAIAADLAYLGTVTHGDVEIVSRALDDQYWVVAYLVDDGPARFYLYDRPARAATFLFTNRRELEGLPLATMRPVVITARDGLALVSYYTLPHGSARNPDGIPDRPLPLILVPHGGPWGRDFWGYHGLHQWLANRGYAVLAVNFRASTGFGKAFVNAGNGEWGGKIIADQIDAVRWACRAGIADPARVGILGGSFGGYSVLAGLAWYPDVFACGVDLVGPSSLITLLESVPPYWKPLLAQFTTRIGDHRTPEGRALLQRHSPLTAADRIGKPLLIGQGANDPRVKQAESDQIVNALKAKGVPVTYVLYPDEGHGFVRPENNLAFFALAEAFLAKHLGGRCEPIGDDFTGSSHQVLTGAAEIPGLSAGPR